MNFSSFRTETKEVTSLISILDFVLMDIKHKLLQPSHPEKYLVLELQKSRPKDIRYYITYFLSDQDTEYIG